MENIEYRAVTTEFHRNLKEKINNIKSDSKIIVPADKTNNFYKLEKEDFLNLVEKNVHKEYKKAKKKEIDISVNAHKKIVKNLNLEDRVFATQKKECFINLKDHKPNFHNNPACRLINPCKPEIGKISKNILAKIVKSVRKKSELVQWENSNEVITWFNAIKDKKTFTFIQFDIVNFYPSISEQLLKDALNWARTFVDISDEDENIIFKSKMSLLHFKDQTWIKKSNPIFDITMGSFDGAESCDICGLFLLSKLQHISISA